MKLILMGAPGSGKGTQAETLVREFNIPAISTGNILREAIKNETETGLRAKEYTNSGRLVPDDIMVNIVRERLSQEDCLGGFILDGFPRTIAQAEALDKIGVSFDAVLSMEVPDEDIERRMSGRRVCESCGTSYHVEHRPPKTDGVCDTCAGVVSQRPDDVPETVRKRLSVYHESTEPVKGFYEKRGQLRAIAAHDEIAAIGARMLSVLKAL